MSFQYQGFPEYIAQAGEGRSDIVRNKARQQPAVHSLSSLLVQAMDVPVEARLGILVAASEWVEALEVASDAAALMHASVLAALVPPVVADVSAPQEPEPTDELPKNGRRRKG